jgi:hypothetical protein
MDYTDDYCMESFTSSQFDRMLAMYDKYRADAKEVVSSTSSGMGTQGYIVQNAWQSQNQNYVPPTPPTTPTQPTPPTTSIPPTTPAPPRPEIVTQNAPPSTCNRLPDGHFCRRDVQCCSGDCFSSECRPSRR